MVIARNSNLLGKITILVMGIFVVNTALALDGSGTEQDPWRIQSLDDFNDFAGDPNYWADFTRLETDVNLAGMAYTRAVIAPDVNNTDWEYDGTAFTGVFDGNDHKIINLTIDDDGAGDDYLGLFGYIDGGEVRNLGIDRVYIIGDHIVGGLVGINSGSLLGCYSTGYVNGDIYYTGGLCAKSTGPSHGTEQSRITNCYSTAIVTGYGPVGGLIGHSGAIVTGCYSTGDVSGHGSIGGLIGSNGGHGSITNCHSTGDVNGVYGSVGGLVGYDDYDEGSIISNCYSTGDVSSYTKVGGLVGESWSIISNCYSTGDVNGVYNVGGLIGYKEQFSVSNCFWDTAKQTHGVTKSIGFPHNTTISNVHGLPTSQLHQQSTFTDWDFINVWNIGENQTYPYLRVYLPSDINKDRIVNFLDFAIAANQWLQEQ